VGFATPTKSMTPHIKKKNCTKKNINPSTTDFHLKEGRKEKEEKEEKRKKEEKEEDMGLQTHGTGAMDPRPA
jgi:hypothetical protein